MHQEHLENGEKYDHFSNITKRILAVPTEKINELAEKCATKFLSEGIVRTKRVVRLRDLLMPLWAEFYYEIVFEEECHKHARELIVSHATNVALALKCCSLRDMRKRDQLTRFIRAKLRQKRFKQRFPGHYSLEEKALYIQGVYFTTGVIQMSEAMAHLLLTLAQHPNVQKRLAQDTSDNYYYDMVMTENLRLFPLFGIAHRITTDEIVLDQNSSIPSGSVLCFNYPEYHKQGYVHPEKFFPERWQHLSKKEANYIPFGVHSNRPCPAHRIAWISMMKVTQIALKRFEFYSSVKHTRSLPSRGPSLIANKNSRVGKMSKTVILECLRMRDGWEDFYRIILQLLLGTYMVWDARKLRLCERHFRGGSVCPVTGKKNIEVAVESNNEQ